MLILWCLSNYLIRKITKNEKAIFLINLCEALILLLFSYYCSINHIVYKEGFETVSSAYIMIFLGYYFKRTVPPIIKTKDALIMLGISFILLEGLYRFCRLMGWNSKINDYGEPLLLIMTSIAGFFVLYFASILINLKCPNKLLITIGRNTMSIVLIHFLAFKLVNILYVAIYDLPRYMIAAFPILYRKWSILYCIVGVALPVCLSIAYYRVKAFVVDKGKTYQLFIALLILCFYGGIVGFNIVNQNNLKYDLEYGYEWKSGYYDDGWLTDVSELMVYNRFNETKHLEIECYVIPEMDTIEVSICNEIGDLVYTKQLKGGSNIIELLVKQGESCYYFSFSNSFNPKQEGMNEDTRLLSVLVVSIN